MEPQLTATQEHFKDFTESVIWMDLQEYFRECLEVNRDLLEGVRKFNNPETSESNDVLIGRNRQLRDIIGYVNERANT